MKITAETLTTKKGSGATQQIALGDGFSVTFQPARESPTFGNDICLIKMYKQYMINV